MHGVMLCVVGFIYLILRHHNYHILKYETLEPAMYFLFAMTICLLYYTSLYRRRMVKVLVEQHNT